MLSSLSIDAVQTEAPRAKARRLRRVRRASSWLLLTGWIVLPLMPMIALALSKMLGIEF